MNEHIERSLESLVNYPLESLDIEIKDWLNIDEREHQANLIKAILALANNGGCYLLIGFLESGGVYNETETNDTVRALYNQDRINGIIARYADPQIHAEFYVIVGNWWHGKITDIIE